MRTRTTFCSLRRNEIHLMWYIYLYFAGVLRVMSFSCSRISFFLLAPALHIPNSSRTFCIRTHGTDQSEVDHHLPVSRLLPRPIHSGGIFFMPSIYTSISLTQIANVTSEKAHLFLEQVWAVFLSCCTANKGTNQSCCTKRTSCHNKNRSKARFVVVSL